MRRILPGALALLFIAIAAGGVQAQEDPVALAPDELEWEKQPDGSLMAVLYGNPAAEGPYALRFKLPEDWAGRPHTHGGAELVTVISGTFYFALGDDLSREAASAFGPGTFIGVPKGTKMRPYTGDEEVVVDVHGQGPFTTQYLDEEGY